MILVDTYLQNHHLKEIAEMEVVRALWKSFWPLIFAELILLGLLIKWGI
jgi:hypothetical protein